MKTSIYLAGLFLCLLPLAVMAAPTHKTAAKKTAATMYECTKCHMRYTAAQAKKDHYRDPMDGGKLVSVKVPAGKQSSSMGGMKM